MRLLDVGLWYRRDNPQCFAVTGLSKPRPIYMNWPQLSPAEPSTQPFLLPLPVHVSFERYHDWPINHLSMVPAMDGAPGFYPEIRL